VRVVEKAEAQGVSNLYMLLGDAEHMCELFSAKSVHQLYVNFPDPWDKERWHKHRILDTEFFKAAATVLVPGGKLDIKTDHDGYYQAVLQCVKEADAQFQLTYQTADLELDDMSADSIQTEFEMLFRSQNKPVKIARLVRR
jgi:tRNA (guanine-N7-)-methyltransferase